MKFFTVDEDPAWRIRERVYYDDDRIVLEQRQNVDAIIESNKARYNAVEGTARQKAWRGDMVMVASVPLVVMEDLIKRGIMTRSYKIPDEARFDAWLNNPDNRVWRTLAGKI